MGDTTLTCVTKYIITCNDDTCSQLHAFTIDDYDDHDDDNL